MTPTFSARFNPLLSPATPAVVMGGVRAVRDPLSLRFYSGWLATRHTLALHRGHHRASRRWAQDRKAVTS